MRIKPERRDQKEKVSKYIMDYFCSSQPSFKGRGIHPSCGGMFRSFQWSTAPRRRQLCLRSDLEQEAKDFRVDWLVGVLPLPARILGSSVGMVENAKTRQDYGLSHNPLCSPYRRLRRCMTQVNSNESQWNDFNHVIYEQL